MRRDSQPPYGRSIRVVATTLGDRLVTDLPITRIAGCVVAEYPAEIDVANAPALQEQLRELLDSRPPRLVLDLTNTTFFGSHGVKTIVRAARQARALAVPLAVAIPEEGLVSRVFAVTGLAELVSTASSVAAACPPRPRR